MIYIQSNNKIPMWDFGSHALHGCLNTGKSYKLCEGWDMPKSDATCLIGSVEWCQKWLKENGHKVPDAMKLSDFNNYLGRDIWVQDSKEFLDKNTVWPLFVKPFDQIKAFTGTIVTSNFDAHCVLQDFEGKLCVQTAIDPIVSEWRVYVNRGKILGCKHYKGDSLVFPVASWIEKVVDHSSVKFTDKVSYTLDFGVHSPSPNHHATFLIEPNDGWAIGNYGLEPEDYLRFCEDRWKQIIA